MDMEKKIKKNLPLILHLKIETKQGLPTFVMN